MSQGVRYHYGTGRRKQAVARVRLYPGNGEVTINNKPSTEYFGGRAIHQATLAQPLRHVNAVEKFNVFARVRGGGTSGQAGAVRHGIARALVASDPELRKSLKDGGFLTRDARVKERKKPGLKRARKAPQYTKR